ncbi:MAG: periplasmic heavy metal sensor [Roseinatronobacter sp.]
MTETVPFKPRSPLWMKLLLGFSIILNLGLAGMLVGFATGSARDGSVISAAVAALPDEARRDMRRGLRRDWSEARGRAQSHGVRTEILALLRADPFDAAAFEASLEQGRQHLAEIGQKQRERLTAEVAAMTPAQRQAYALAIEERLNKRRPMRP